MLLNRMCGGLEPINSSPDKLAIQGYDPVSYFTEGKAEKGNSDFSYEWRGATWLFSNSDHLACFIANPEKYSPQYGGYCAYGISIGKFFNGDPEIWTIKEGKLYVYLNQDLATIWGLDVPAYIKKADIEWPKLIA